VDSRLKIAGMTGGKGVIPEIFNQESRGGGRIHQKINLALGG